MKNTLSAGSAAVTAAIAVAVSAAAPEFIWQGLRVLFAHLSWSSLVSTILIAVILVFFVDPILERLRGWLSGARSAAGRPRHLLVAAAVGLLVAMTSVGLHDAMTAFAIGDDAGENVGLGRAITVTISWGVVPFAVTLAWQAASDQRLAVPVGIVAAASSVVAGWYFDWGIGSTITTAIPCLAIQFFGYRQAGEPGMVASLGRYAPTLAAVAIVWLLCAALFDGAVVVLHAPWLSLYDPPDYFIDARFYFGWFLGLILTGPDRLRVTP